MRCLQRIAARVIWRWRINPQRHVHHKWLTFSISSNTSSALKSLRKTTNLTLWFFELFILLFKQGALRFPTLQNWQRGRFTQQQGDQQRPAHPVKHLNSDFPFEAPPFIGRKWNIRRRSENSCRLLTSEVVKDPRGNHIRRSWKFGGDSGHVFEAVLSSLSSSLSSSSS